MRFPRPIASALVLAAALGTMPTRADAADGEQNQAAVDLAYEGKERFEAADYATALDRFRKAQALAASPVFDLYIARSLRALGRWRDALVAYEATAQYRVEATNVSFKQAQENAKNERQELQESMPKLNVSAPHAGGQAPELKIDGEVTRWPVKNLALDPGKHVVAATLGEETYDDVLTLAAGERFELELPFGRGDSVAPEDKTSAPTSEGANRHGLSPLAWTAFGIGAAGLALGATTGTWALVNMSELNAHCDMAACPDGIPDNAEYASLRNTTAALATTADIGFIVAGAGALLGLTFALTLGKSERAPAPSAHLELRPSGPGLVLSGAF